MPFLTYEKIKVIYRLALIGGTDHKCFWSSWFLGLVKFGSLNSDFESLNIGCDCFVAQQLRSASDPLLVDSLD